MLWKIILPVFAVLCLIYYIVLRLSTGKWNSTFARVWPVAGVLLLAFSYMEWKGYLPRICLLLLAIFIGMIVVTMIPVFVYMLLKEQKSCEYLIVLGAHVNGRTPSDSLERRIQKAMEYLSEHPDTKVIVSGGQGKGEDITEAEAMEIYLWEHGIGKERILTESASTTTKENLFFSKKLFTAEFVNVGIVTNNFHLYRSCACARRLGYRKVYPISAGCRKSLFLNYLMREVFALWKFWLDKGKDRDII